MKQLTELLKLVENGKIHKEIIKYFEMFIPSESLEKGNYCFIAYNEDGTDRTVKEWTQENVLEQLKTMTAEGFVLAFSHRGTASAWLGIAIKVYLNLLEDGWDKKLAKSPMTVVYCLPLLKAVAIRYDFENRIDGDNGDEDQYYINMAMVRDAVKIPEKKVKAKEGDVPDDDE